MTITTEHSKVLQKKVQNRVVGIADRIIDFYDNKPHQTMVTVGSTPNLILFCGMTHSLTHHFNTNKHTNHTNFPSAHVKRPGTGYLNSHMIKSPNFRPLVSDSTT